MWDLPRPGIKPVFLALVGGFLTTAPPGKPSSHSNNCLKMPILLGRDHWLCPLSITFSWESNFLHYLLFQNNFFLCKWSGASGCTSGQPEVGPPQRIPLAEALRPESVVRTDQNLSLAYLSLSFLLF